MRSLIAFTKKEWMEQLRSGRLIILGILFVFMGVMSPATAKLTPWLLGMFADSLENSGVIINDITVTAMDSWVQFYKNIPIALITFVLLECGIFTREYRMGTLALALTKGLERRKVTVSKASVLLIIWSAGYWSSFLITYVYNSYYWDNSAAQNLMLSAFCFWVFGAWIVAMIVLFSAMARENTGVLAGIGVTVLCTFIVSIIPKIKVISPFLLTDANSLIYGLKDKGSFIVPVAVTLILIVTFVTVSVPILNRKRI